MSDEKNKPKTRRDHLSVITNLDYGNDTIVVKGWRRAAEIFNASEGERLAEDARQELQKMRRNNEIKDMI